MAFTPTHSAPWSTLTLLRSTQRGRKKEKRRWFVTSASACRNGSDLTDLRGGALVHACRDFPYDENLKISLGDSPICLQKYHSRSIHSFTLLWQSILQKGHAAAALWSKAVKAMSLGVYTLLVILSNGKWAALHFFLLVFHVCFVGICFGKTGRVV